MIKTKTMGRKVETILSGTTVYDAFRPGTRTHWKNTKRALRRKMKSGQWHDMSMEMYRAKWPEETKKTEGVLLDEGKSNQTTLQSDTQR